MKKLRMTHQREIILQELNKSKNHPSADELFERVKKKLPRISLATVYRNLEILSETGTINKIEISGRQKRFDWNLSKHNHIYCVQCHRVDNIDMKSNEKPSLQTDDKRGYQIEGCRIEFYGYCSDCQKIIKQKGGKKMGCKKCVPAVLSDDQRKVLGALANSKEACGTKDISAATSLDAKQVSSQITALKKKGYIASPVRCKYEITKEGKKAIA
ncbi:MAG: transcriptional repressor [Desulfobulbaceae bacterium]|nr:transcriptional repressor [Desulfobulbaceae bacterium]